MHLCSICLLYSNKLIGARSKIGGPIVKGNVYITQLKNTICVDSPNYIKQKFLNDLRTKGICTYKKDEKEKLYLRGIETKESKIKEAIKFNMNAALKIYEDIEFRKAYKYSVAFKFDLINLDKIVEDTVNINEISYTDINEMDDYNIINPIIITDNEMMYLKFTKSIDIVWEEETSARKLNIRYPIVVAINTEEMIFDIRFDRLYHNNNENFYKMCIDSVLMWLRNDKIENIMSIELDPIVKYALENRQDEVEEEISSFGLNQEKGATLKAGKDKVMPFIGDLRNILKSNEELFNTNEATKSCLEVINNYISDTLRFADYKYRILNIIKRNVINTDEKNINENIGIKIIFNYRGQGKDLINFYNPEINNLERINHVVKYIRSIEKCIESIRED